MESAARTTLILSAGRSVVAQRLLYEKPKRYGLGLEEAEDA
jgi:hypothetical protein